MFSRASERSRTGMKVEVTRRVADRRLRALLRDAERTIKKRHAEVG